MAGLTEIKANSASQQSWSLGLAELGNLKCFTILLCSLELIQNYKTPFRQFPDTFQTPSRQFSDNFQTPSKVSKSPSFRKVCGGVGSSWNGVA